MKSREQTLVDICFSLVLACLDEDYSQPAYWKGKSNEEKAQWVRDQLRDCGFKVSDTVGISWGILEIE